MLNHNAAVINPLAFERKIVVRRHKNHVVLFYRVEMRRWKIFKHNHDPPLSKVLLVKIQPSPVVALLGEDGDVTGHPFGRQMVQNVSEHFIVKRERIEHGNAQGISVSIYKTPVRIGAVIGKFLGIHFPTILNQKVTRLIAQGCTPVVFHVLQFHDEEFRAVDDAHGSFQNVQLRPLNINFDQIGQRKVSIFHHGFQFHPHFVFDVGFGENVVRIGVPDFLVVRVSTRKIVILIKRDPFEIFVAQHPHVVLKRQFRIFCFIVRVIKQLHLGHGIKRINAAVVPDLFHMVAPMQHAGPDVVHHHFFRIEFLA